MVRAASRQFSIMAINIEFISQLSGRSLQRNAAALVVFDVCFHSVPVVGVFAHIPRSLFGIVILAPQTPEATIMRVGAELRVLRQMRGIPG